MRASISRRRRPSWGSAASRKPPHSQLAPNSKPWTLNSETERPHFRREERVKPLNPMRSWGSAASREPPPPLSRPRLFVPASCEPPNPRGYVSLYRPRVSPTALSLGRVGLPTLSLGLFGFA